MGFIHSMLTPKAAKSWTVSDAAHLLNRAGFGGTPEEINTLHAMGLAKAVDTLVKGEEDSDLFPVTSMPQPGDLVAHYLRTKAAKTEEEKRALFQQQRILERQSINNLRAWWLNRMRYTPYPLREKMTLFWHGHFATSFEKTNVTYQLWQQNETMRANALGNFRILTKEISKDPAMMRYLDTVASAKTKPNENFARELMELFTLGEGVVYTEKDIQESARAFTGYRINKPSQQFMADPKQFDSTDKVFLGRTGPFNGDNVIDIILERPECSEFIARKFWKFFVSDDPPEPAVKEVAAHFKKSDYDIASTMKLIFLSEQFYSPKVVRSQVKSPVQWIVQTARVLDAPLPERGVLDESLNQMGQMLFNPPNVKGWDGGKSWISSSTLLFRYNLAGYIVSGKSPQLAGLPKQSGPIAIDLRRVAPSAMRADPEKLCEHISQRLFNGSLPEQERERLLSYLKENHAQVDDPALRDFLHLMMSTPEYQLT